MIDLHIILSTIALIIMIVAGVLALLLALQDYLLKSQKKLYLFQTLPSLETSEKWLFRMIFLGFIVLSAVLLSSILYFHAVFSPELRQKTILAIINWCVFAGLLYGRMHWGWRGRIAIHLSLAGVVLLLIIYCGTGFFLNAH